MKLIKRRIASVANTQQIMKAMDLVAASKLQKAKSRLDTIRPLFAETKRIMDNIQWDDATRESIYVAKRDVKRTAYILITSDRGLCGGYNSNVSKEAFNHIVTENKNETVITVGAKGWEFLRRRGKSIHERLSGVSENVFYQDAERVGDMVRAMFTEKDEAKAVQEVYMVYTHFASMMSHVPKAERILPLTVPQGSGGGMNYEPNLETFLQDAIPMYVNVFIYGAMLESAACEQAARMMSMDAAAKNAEEIIDDLTLAYNRKRQGIITQEINEIVSGANALQ
jgi:F-type H+-transporting ATPase subunit gamma